MNAYEGCLGDQWEGAGGKERIMRSEEDGSTLYIYI
jgi:hypothetical protein